jgi:uncharacterized protein (DUF488 family)
MTANPICSRSRDPSPASNTATALPPNHGLAGAVTGDASASDGQRTGSRDHSPIYTIGHSTLTVAQVVEILHRHHIGTLVDIRSFPRSSHNPQFNAETLASELAGSAIDYLHEPRLGGYRHHSAIDGKNAGWRNASFRAFADYMATSEFQDGLQAILDLSLRWPLAIMCSEAVPWRCHRSLVADALLACDAKVFEIVGGRVSPHRMTRFAQVDGTRVTYPGEAPV